MSVYCKKSRFKKHISIWSVDRSVSLKLSYPGAEPGLFRGGAGTMGSQNQWGMFLNFSQTFCNLTTGTLLIGRVWLRTKIDIKRFFFLIRDHGCSLVQSGEYLLIPSCDRRESIVVNISKFSLVKNSKLVHTYIEKNFYSRSENNSEIWLGADSVQTWHILKMLKM